MFTRSGNSTKFDSIAMMEAKILAGSPTSRTPTVEADMVYVDSISGHTYGRCRITQSMFRKETMEALARFLDLAEEDFGHVAFGEGTTTATYGGVFEAQTAEDSSRKLDKRSLGGV
jgi:hypothetical protein